MLKDITTASNEENKTTIDIDTIRKARKMLEDKGPYVAWFGISPEAMYWLKNSGQPDHMNKVEFDHFIKTGLLTFQGIPVKVESHLTGWLSVPYDKDGNVIKWR